jgi:uncharacterized protein YigA (DUF484 family)
MKASNAHRQERDGVTAASVEAYLRRHPDFFHHHLDLLEGLKLPHPCGSAVSLVSRQIELLRERSRKLQLQLNDLLQIARDNDALFRRAHQVTLSLLDATSLDDALAGLRWLLHGCFEADFVTVRLIRPVIDSPIANLCIPPDSEELAYIQLLLEQGKPECGQPTLEHAEFLFGADAKEVLSYALVPLQHAGLRGFLAIGSRSPSRFQAGMGHFFLSQMGEIVAARFVSLLSSPA